MRWSPWLSAAIVSTCARQISSTSADCQPTGTAPHCEDTSSVAPCLAAARNRGAEATVLCERAWQDTRSEAAAVAGAKHALCTGDDAALERWGQRALPTMQGARILGFVGEMQHRHDDFAAAEVSFGRALALQIDRDPGRAANTALWLFELARSNHPAEDSVRFARLAWEQAELGSNEISRANAAMSLVELLIDLGELPTAAAVIDRMDDGDAPPWRKLRDLAAGRLEAARGRIATAIALFQRARRLNPTDEGPRSALPHDSIELVQALLDAGQVGEARRELGDARARLDEHTLSSPDVAARYAAVEAAVELAEDDSDAALSSVERGLALAPRDAARIWLLNVRGDALARRGDAIAAEHAWRDAADSVEAWRASLPTLQLRSGLVARHRHALESWLDSTGARGDVAGALEVTRRIAGRELLDRIAQREADAPMTADASIRDVENRLAIRHELGVTMTGAQHRRDLRDVAHDMVAIMLGARFAWAIRHVRGGWSIDRVGERAAVRRWIDAYRGNIDDRGAAATLGAALFPEATLPATGAPLVVLLDREISDIALAGLRTGDAYLVERVAILEVLAPDLLFAPVPDRAWGPAVAIGDPKHDLKAAAGEVDAMAHETGARRYVGALTTHAELLASAGAFALHIATHSKIEDGLAAFVLSDGAMSSSDIVSRRIAPRLAVIATCRSQVDDDPSRSLVAAFLAAGSPAVIGVKRALDDRLGAALMRSFYRLHGAMDPMRALALAQRAAIAANQPPSAWATVSFFGVGGWIEP